jgi:hypothetical protein
VTLTAVSRAPFTKIEAYKKGHGLVLPMHLTSHLGPTPIGGRVLAGGLGKHMTVTARDDYGLCERAAALDDDTVVLPLLLLLLILGLCRTP